MKICPFCAEEIQDAAIVCKHCGRDLPGAAPAAEASARNIYATTGSKIEAIKKLRESTGASLVDAKKIVESWPLPTVEQHASGNKAAIGCGVLIVIAILLAVIGSFSSNDNAATPNTRSRQIEAYTICQKFVQDRLRAPKSADFQGSGDAKIQSVGTDEYEVSAYVDSQNGFGAMLRMNFVCTVKPTDKAGEWRLVDLKVNGK